MTTYKIVAALAALLIAAPALAETKSTVRATASGKIVNGVVTIGPKTSTRTTVVNPDRPQHERSVMRSVEVRPGGIVRVRTLVIDSVFGNSYTIETRLPTKASTNGQAKSKR